MNTLIAAVFSTDQSNPNITLAITDSQNNFWTRSALEGGPQGTLGLFSAYLSTALTTSDTITVAQSSTQAAMLIVGEFTGIVAQLDTEAPVDVSLASTTGIVANTGPYSIGPTAATSYAVEVAVAAFYNQNTGNAFTAGSGYTSVGTVSSASANGTIGMEYQLLTTAATQNAVATFAPGTSAKWSAVVATYITDTPVNAPAPLIGT